MWVSPPPDTDAGPASWADAAPLPRRFYERPVLRVARALLGRVLVARAGRERLAARIVEVEAYRGSGDPASHAFRGETPRTRVMFGAPGHAYVYFTYGMHHCLNVVCEREGKAAAVLIRAAEPLAGLARMRARRRGVPDERLLRGPGCVAQALALSREHSGVDLTRGEELWIADAPADRGGRRIAGGPRIGIRVALDRPWRFFLAGHPLVSSPRLPGSARTPAKMGGRRAPVTRRARIRN